MTVVLDDFERISDAGITAWLGWVIQALPPSIRMVVCSRAEPDLPRSRWLASNWSLTRARASSSGTAPCASR